MSCALARSKRFATSCSFPFKQLRNTFGRYWTLFWIIVYIYIIYFSKDYCSAFFCKTLKILRRDSTWTRQVIWIFKFFFFTNIKRYCYITQMDRTTNIVYYVILKFLLTFSSTTLRELNENNNNNNNTHRTRALKQKKKKTENIFTYWRRRTIIIEKNVFLFLFIYSYICLIIFPIWTNTKPM